MAVGHGIAGFHILSPPVYSYISGKSVTDIVVCVDELPEGDVHTFLKKVWL